MTAAGATRRYATDPAFRTLVDTIAAYLRAEHAPLLDVDAAVKLAAWHVAEAERKAAR